MDGDNFGGHFGPKKAANWSKLTADNEEIDRDGAQRTATSLWNIQGLQVMNWGQLGGRQEALAASEPPTSFISIFAGP